MCGRYTLTTTAQLIGDRFGAGAPPEEALGRWNVAPTETMAIVVTPKDEPEGRELVPARWGLLPHWARDLSAKPMPINARSESAATHKSFSRLMGRASGRCLVIADGWYEWLRPEDKKLKPTPFRYTVDDGGPFAFAGLVARRRIGEDRITCALILTCTANDVCARVHDRMPVVLPGPEEEAAWLSPSLDADAATASVRPARVRASHRRTRLLARQQGRHRRRGPVAAGARRPAGGAGAGRAAVAGCGRSRSPARPACSPCARAVRRRALGAARGGAGARSRRLRQRRA